jgi:deoxyhypusine synthase
MASRFLKSPTIPLRVKKGKTAAHILEDMRSTGFQGRKLGEAFSIWREMLEEKKITIWLGISGAVVPAGMRRLLVYLIKNRYVDVVVSTGAQIFHDACEALGVRHFRGTHQVDDSALLKEGIDRFHDVFVKEELQRKVDRQIQKFIETLEPRYQYSSREFLFLLGKHLKGLSRHQDSILIQASETGVPVFSPALADSSIGYSFVMARRGIRDMADGRSFKETGRAVYRYVDQFKDIDETVQIAEHISKSGVVYLGGGVPKNFVQQTELLNLILGNELPGHEYAIQITTDNPQFGGLSGCTLEEAVSWGKIAEEARTAQCFCDLTIALPFLVHALAQEEKLARRRKKPIFDWSGRELKIEYA